MRYILVLLLLSATNCVEKGDSKTKRITQEERTFGIGPDLFGKSFIDEALKNPEEYKYFSTEPKILASCGFSKKIKREKDSPDELLFLVYEHEENSAFIAYYNDNRVDTGAFVAGRIGNISEVNEKYEIELLNYPTPLATVFWMDGNRNDSFTTKDIKIKLAEKRVEFMQVSAMQGDCDSEDQIVDNNRLLSLIEKKIKE